MSIFINPGTGPIVGATEENAAFNAGVFSADLMARGLQIQLAQRAVNLDDEGRFGWRLYFGAGRSVEIEMPGLPLAQVRYIDPAEQNIWDFPRLYVDGSSWVWCYALDACEPEDEDES
jgi:hypothetical protein